MSDVEEPEDLPNVEPEEPGTYDDGESETASDED